MCQSLWERYVLLRSHSLVPWDLKEEEDSPFSISKLTIKHQLIRPFGTDVSINDWKRTESPEIHPYIYGQLISNISAKTMQ